VFLFLTADIQHFVTDFIVSCLAQAKIMSLEIKFAYSPGFCWMAVIESLRMLGLSYSSMLIVL